MLDTFNRMLANAIYLVPLQVKRFKAKEPDSQILVAGATKAQKGDEDTGVRYEPGWIVSRRGVLILTSDKLVCGFWEIPLTSVINATLLRFKGLLSRWLVLKVATDDGSHYQFGLQYDPTWETQTALKLTVEDGKIKYSAFSIVVRVALILALIGLVWSLIQ
ncbi:MAG: hypothetical protein ACE5LU_19365 [Anaerolineae bacterium]